MSPPQCFLTSGFEKHYLIVNAFQIQILNHLRRKKQIAIVRCAGKSGTHTATLARSSSAKELLPPFREVFHPFQGFLLRYHRSTRTFGPALACFLFSLDSRN
jgi:hypothetical protein